MASRSAAWSLVLISLLSLSACHATPETAPPPAVSSAIVLSAAPAGTPTPSALASSTPTAPAATPSATAASTPLPSPTAPEPGATATLAPGGPWLLYACQPEDKPAPDILISNLDGSSPTTLGIPLTQDNWRIERTFQVAPSGRHLAVLVAPAERDYQVWIRSLPSGAVLRTIPLLSPEAVRVIESFRPGTDGMPDQLLHPISGILESEPTLLWSPSGRYLVFLAAIDGPSLDVYTYDVLADRIQRATSGPTQAILMGWSPDSRWIVHMAATNYYDGFADIQAVWAASPDGLPPRYLYRPDGWVFEERIVGWTSSDSFAVEGWVFESPLRAIYEVDIGDERRTPIFDIPSMGAQFDPSTRTLMVEVSGFLGPGLDIDQGIYCVALPSESPRLVLPGEFYGLTFHPQLGLFSVHDSQRDLILFDSHGNTLLTIPGGSLLAASPDGTLSVVGSPSGLALLDRDLELRPVQGDASVVRWSPDSTSFVAVHSGSIYLYTREGDWSPLLVSGPPYLGGLAVIAPQSP